MSKFEAEQAAAKKIRIEGFIVGYGSMLAANMVYRKFISDNSKNIKTGKRYIDNLDLKESRLDYDPITLEWIWPSDLQ